MVKLMRCLACRRLLLESIERVVRAFSFFASSGGDISATQFIMKKRILRLKLHGYLQIGNRAGDVSLLKQGLAKFITCVRKVGIDLDYVLQHLDAADHGPTSYQILCKTVLGFD